MIQQIKKGKSSWACCVCQKIKLKNNFQKQGKYVDGTPMFASICNKCKKKYHQRLCWRLRGINIQQSEFDSLAQKQNYRCAICNRKTRTALCVDHDHETNVIRGLVCKSCNLGLGYFQENPDFLIGASTYIKKNNKLTLVA